MNSSMVSDYLLESGAAILTGGVDLLGNPLLIIHPGSVQQCELVALLLHYLKTMALSQTSPPTITCVADLQTSSKDDIVDFVEALETVETPVRGRITALYLLKPKVKDRRELLKKLLGLKTSKTYNKAQLFRVFMVKTRRDLHKYIEVSQLPEELGGGLPYDHQAWLYFYRTVTPCIQSTSELLRRLPDMRDRVELLQEYDLTGQRSSELTSLKQELLQTYQTLIREARLAEIVEQCKQTMHFLETPEDSSLVHVHSRLVQEAVHRLRTSFTQIKEYETELRVLWDKADERLVTAHKIQKCREQAEQVEETIGKKYRPQLKEHPAVGKTLSQAELYRTHFTAAIYEPSKELLSIATETLEELTKLSAEIPGIVALCTDITQRLSQAIHPFTEQLQQLQTTYVAVHVFHILLNKSVHWYKKVLKFLPDTLRHHVTQRLPKKVIATPPEWALAVRAFLGKHPPPREEHIIKMDSDIPHQIHRSLKQQAHTVALRIRFLNRLLRSKSWPIKLVVAAFKWKDELSGRHSYQFTRRQSAKSKRNPRKNSQKENTANCLNVSSAVTWKRQPSDSYVTDTDVTARQQRQRGSVGAAHPTSSHSSKRTYPDSTTWEESASKHVDVEELSERYHQNWEEQASDRQLYRSRNIHNQPITEQTQELTPANQLQRFQNKPITELTQELTPANQLQRYSSRHNKPVMEETQSYTFYNSQNDEHKMERDYSPRIPIHSIPSENKHNSPLKSPHSMSGDSKRSSTFKSPLSTLGQNKLNSSQRSSPSTVERFVKLSLTPNKYDKSQKVFLFDGSTQNDAGSESGIEVTENEDPYDSVMSKIRAVSTSLLPSDLKLKYVSDLISCSLRSDDTSSTLGLSDRKRQQPRNFSKSEGQMRRKFSNCSSEQSSLHGAEQVSKLRQQLAHSMINLNQFDSPGEVKLTQSLVDLSVTDRTCNQQFNQSLKCSFRPQDLSLVLEDVSGDGQMSEIPFSKISSCQPVNDPAMFIERRGLNERRDLNDKRGLYETRGLYNRRSLSLDDLLDESLSLGPPSSTLSELDLARSGQDFAEWTSVDDTDSDSLTSLQEDLDRLRYCEEQRLAEVVELTEEQGRYTDIQLNAESVAQDNVESSLHRSHNILQQEEAALYPHLRSGSSSSQSVSSLVSETHAFPVRLKKSLSGDQGYDSTTSHRTGVSSLPGFCPIPGALPSYRNSPATKRDTFDGPDFY